MFRDYFAKSGLETNSPGETEEFYDIGTKARIIRFEALQKTTLFNQC